MLYKIKKIYHTGKFGVRGTKRTDGRYPLRINRIVDIEKEYLQDGIPLILRYIADPDGNLYHGNPYLRCSVIQAIHLLGDDSFSVETQNSIYEFKKV